LTRSGLVPGGDLFTPSQEGSAELADLERARLVLEVVAEPGHDLRGDIRSVWSYIDRTTSLACHAVRTSLRGSPASSKPSSRVRPLSSVGAHRKPRFHLASYPKNNFPSLDVYGPTDTSTLRLITCTGSFSRARHSDRDNLVVYAKLKAQRKLADHLDAVARQ
jgi:hypothetical protein